MATVREIHDLEAAARRARDYAWPVVGHVDRGYFNGPTGLVELRGKVWFALVDRIAGRGYEAAEVPFKPLDDDRRRRFLSAASMLCGFNGVQCASCREAEMLRPLGFERVAELLEKK